MGRARADAPDSSTGDVNVTTSGDPAAPRRGGPSGQTHYIPGECGDVASRRSYTGGAPDRTAAPDRIPPQREDTLRDLGIGNSILKDIITVPYGLVKTPGKLILAEVQYTTLYCLWCAGFGELESFVNVKMNEEDITEIDGLITTETKLGTAAQTVTAIMTNFGHDEEHPGLALYGATFYVPDSDFGGSLDIEFEVEGRKCYDFRPLSGTFDTFIFTENPVLIIYDILTASWPWTSEIDPADIDLDSWVLLADKCDIVFPSDPESQAQWIYRGVFEERDAWAAANEVLRHVHMHVSAVGDKFYLWQEGDTVANGGYITPKTYTIDEYFKTPECVEAEPGTITTEINVLYWSHEDNDNRNINAMVASGPDEYVFEEIAMNGFRQERMSKRWGDQEIALKHETIGVTLYTGPEAAQLLPGDIVPCDLKNGFGTQNIRVLEIPTEVEKGKYTIKGRIYDLQVQSVDEGVVDQGGPWDPPWHSSVANLPSSVNQEFDFNGGWGNYTRGGNPDDLSAGWVETSCEWILDGGGEFSTLSPVNGNCAVKKIIDWTDYVAVPDRQLVCFLYRTNSEYVDDADALIQVVYASQFDTGYPFSVQWSTSIKPENDTDHEWKLFVAVIDSSTGDKNHQIAFTVNNYDSPFYDIIDVRSFYWVAWGSNPNLTITERFTYTEHAGAGNTIDQYEIWKAANGEGSLVTAVPQGVDILEGTYLSGVAFNTSPANAVGQFYLRALGINGRRSIIDIDTQTFGGLGNYGLAKSISDIDETGIAVNKVYTVDSDVLTKVLKYINQIPASAARLVTAATDTIVATDDLVKFDTTVIGNNIAFTLPAPGTYTGRTFRYIKIDNSVYTVTFVGAAILGGPYSLFYLGPLTLYDDGTNWIAGV